MPRSLRPLVLLLLSWVLLAPAAAGACSTDTTVTRVERVSMPEDPRTTGVVLAPGTSVKFNYQVQEYVTRQVDNFVDLGGYVWKSRWVDEGRHVWQHRWVDEGSWHWHSNWVDRGWTVQQGYYHDYGYWRTTRSTVVDDTSHWAHKKHNNYYGESGMSWYGICDSHGHDAINGHCDGHSYGFLYHWNSMKEDRAASCLTWYNGAKWDKYKACRYWHETSETRTVTTRTWVADVRWVDTSYWSSYVVDEGSNHWHENWVDRGSYVWQPNWVDRGSYVWQPNLVNQPITVGEWVTRPEVVAGGTPPTLSTTVRLVPGTSITYDYTEILDSCVSPT